MIYFSPRGSTSQKMCPLNCFFCSNFRAVFYYLFLVLRVLSKAGVCQCGSLICVAPSNVVGLALMGMARSSHSYRTKEEQIYCSNIAYTDNLENHTNSNGREMYFLRRLRRRLEKQTRPCKTHVPHAQGRQIKMRSAPTEACAAVRQSHPV